MGSGNQFLQPLQELSVWILSETAAATFCSELFSLPWNGPERKSESLLLFFVPWNGIPSCFLFRWRVWKGILRICFYFCSRERNSELFSLPRKGPERNSENFLFHGTAGIPSDITICSVYSVYSVFRGIIFLSEIPNHKYSAESIQ